MKKINILLFLMTLSFFSIYIYLSSSRFEIINEGNGIVYLAGDDGEVIVPAMIVDSKRVGGFFVGFKLHLDYLECSKGSIYKLRVNNDAQYFIVGDEERYLFSNKEEFIKKLFKLNIVPKVSFDFSKLNAAWSYYSSLQNKSDYSGCLLVSGP